MDNLADMSDDCLLEILDDYGVGWDTIHEAAKRIRQAKARIVKIQLLGVSTAIDNCVGTEIPYSIAKKMYDLNEELRKVLGI